MSRRSVLAVLALAALGGAVAFVVHVSQAPGPGGPAADEIAGAFDCGTTREVRKSADVPQRIRSLANGAEQILYITCDSGEVNPGSFYMRFASAEDLADSLRANEIDADKRFASGGVCVLEREAFTPPLGGFSFRELCSELDGI